ncbi:WD40 repeat [Pyrenophora seminiperda CCB06]|uniref:WD40 repeat n=1 Tax=Pyrenophora seminiperda CCB06 TaxID=1302712 RepID=A0A3M7M9Z2_9PLEO|nr:WD40 repeat [Pyrenophora seminiperda CCB06]
MPFTSQLRTIISRPYINQTPNFFKQSSIRMSSTNQHGQGASHATGQSAVPNKVQEAAPKGLEESLPESVS